MQFRVGIIGCGAMGNAHAKAWMAREDSQVVSVCDLLEDRRVQLAESTGAIAYDAYRDAVLHDGVNVISICTPVCLHSEISCFAAEQGIHVLSEKPLALTIDQADAVVAAARANGIHLSTSFQYRGFPRCLIYKDLFDSSAFGGPVIARFTDVREVRPKLAMHRQSMNGGPIIDMAGHYFDLMRFITGEEPVSVYAQGHIYGRGKERLAGIGDLAVDSAAIEVKMTGGHVLSVLVNWGMPEGYGGYSEEIVMGPALSARPVGGNLEVLSAGETQVIAVGGGPSGPTVRIEGLAAAIRDGTPLEVSGEDGRIALAVSLAVLESIRTGDVVRL